MTTNTIFSLTDFHSTITLFKNSCYGFYNKATRLVHIFFVAYSDTANIPNSEVLCKVPQPYRPKEYFSSYCVTNTVSGNIVVNGISVNESGEIHVGYWVTNANMKFIFASLDYFI